MQSKSGSPIIYVKQSAKVDHHIEVFLLCGSYLGAMGGFFLLKCDCGFFNMARYFLIIRLLVRSVNIFYGRYWMGSIGVPSLLMAK